MRRTPSGRTASIERHPVVLFPEMVRDHAALIENVKDAPVPGPLNSRYFRPVRRKETRACRWDLQFESTSLQRKKYCQTIGPRQLETVATIRSPFPA